MSIGVAIGSGGDDGITLNIQDIAQLGIESVKLILGGTGPSTLLTMPTSCASSSQTTLQGESWGKEGATLSAAFSQMTGCQRLAFYLSASVASRCHRGRHAFRLRARFEYPSARSPGGAGER